MGNSLDLSTYTAVGDIITIVICLILLILLRSTYTVRKHNIILFRLATYLCIIASGSSIFYHYLIDNVGPGKVVILYIVGDIFHISLINLFVVFNLYLSRIINLSKKEIKIFHSIIMTGMVFYSCIQISSPFTHMCMWVDANYRVHDSYYINLFIVTYIFFAFISLYMILVYKRRFITKIRHTLMNIMIFSFICMFAQSFFKQMSFICVSFTFPIMATMFLFHYNAYDSLTGTLDERSFSSYISDFGNRRFHMICMRLRDINDDDRQKLAEHFFHFNEKYFNNPVTFRMKDERMISVYPHNGNEDFARKTVVLMEDFNRLYNKYRIEYKVVFMDSINNMKDASDYTSLCDVLESSMEWDTYKTAKKEDVSAFIRDRRILEELRDISQLQNLDDERIKVYCQPVLKTDSNKFTTAEALMRMELPEIGFVFPDEFISLAEKNGYIHDLSRIILHKTCRAILEIENAGYCLDRVSVNFTITELRDDNFCEDILSIVKNVGVNPEKIAIELTESKNEKDFELVKRVMKILHENGMKFYLDDFGTGYSNFARIIGLPIDIVKFDRSLTIMSGKDEESKYMVEGFADIFGNSNYQVLFEGVEEQEDEDRCKDMNAQYLQGYKYSRPIPIDQLKDYLEKREQ